MAQELSYSSTCGIFLDQGSNPCLLHQQASSFPPSHQGSTLVLTFPSAVSHSVLTATFWAQSDFIIVMFSKMRGGLPVPVLKDSPASAGDTGNGGSIPGSGSSPGAEDGSPLQYSCVENSMDRGAWQAAVHGVSKSQT